MKDKFVSTRIAAEILGVDVISVRRLIGQGELQFVQMNPSKKNSKYLIRMSALELFIKVREGANHGK